MRVKKIICAALAAIICLMLGVGCSYNPEVVMTIDGTDIPSGLYLFYQQTAIQEAYTKYIEDEDNEYLSGVQFIDNKSIEIEGVPVRDWIDDRTLTLIKEYVFVENEFDRLGLSFSDNEKSYNDQITSYQWDSLSSLMQKNGIGYESFETALNNAYKKAELLIALYEKGGELEIPEEDFVEYFEENYTRVDYMQMPTVNALTSEPLTEDEIARIAEIAKQMAEDANGYRGGLETAYFELYGEISAIIGGWEELSTEHFNTLVSLDVIVNSENASLPADFVTGVFEVDAEDNEYKFFQDEETSITIIYRVNGLHEDDKYDEYETSIREKLAMDPFKEYIRSKTALMNVDINKRAKRYYSVDKAMLS